MKIQIKSIFLIVLLCLTITSLSGNEAIDFKLTEQWQHEGDAFGRHFYSVVDQDSHLVGGFYKSPSRVISKEKIHLFGHRGQGPGDLMDPRAMVLYNGDLAILEGQMNRVKIFTKKEGNYVWKETRFLANGKYPSFIKNAVYVADKWFVAGYHAVDMDMKLKTIDTVLLKVFDKEGKFLKSFFMEKGAGPNRLMDMRYHVISDNPKRVFFLTENSLKISIISTGKLEVTKELQLELPSFYKKMPDDFYTMRKFYKNLYKELGEDMEKWATQYSAITGVAFYKNYLIIQVRTVSEDLKKFALLFYNISQNFKLEKTVFLDDFLLGAKEGKFYFFHNGNPGKDEDTDDCIINIYRLKKRLPDLLIQRHGGHEAFKSIGQPMYSPGIA